MLKIRIDQNFARGLLPLVLACLAFAAHAAESESTTTPINTLTYVHLYEDADGISHFGEGSLPLKLEDYSPPTNPMAIHALAKVASATFVLLEKGTDEDWHPVPRRQFAIIMRGAVEVTASDGETRQFRPGDILLLEDIKGKGHQTRVIGDEENLTLMVAVDDI